MRPRPSLLPASIRRPYSVASKARGPRKPLSPPPSPPPPSGPSTISRPAVPSHARPWQRPEPPLVQRARDKSVKQRNVWESYLVLDPRTRLYFSLGLMAFAAVGLYAGDWLVPDSEEEKAGRGGDTK